MALLETPVCDLDQPAIEFNLPGVDGKTWTLQDCQGENGTLIMFICNHCPYVKAIQTRLVRDCTELLRHGIKSVAISCNDPVDYPEDSLSNMKKVAQEFGYPFPYLFDESQEISRAYGAVCTPDFFGYNADMKLQYRGRLDEVTPSNPGSADTERDLFNAMCQIAKTGKGPKEQKVSMGCSIKWRDS